MSEHATSKVSSGVTRWRRIDTTSIDISFVARQHRRRLSTTVQLALTVYNRCNPEGDPLPTVFASRYGEYHRTFGILEDIVSRQPVSPAAFSVSVHNTPSGVTGIATGNSRPSSTVAANGSTIEAGFLEAALQQAEHDEDLLFIYVDEPLPERYRAFRGPRDEASALGLWLTGSADRRLNLTWKSSSDPTGRGTDGLADTTGIVRLLDRGVGRCCNADGRLDWEWTVD
jgi:hypothetical protein